MSVKPAYNFAIFPASLLPLADRWKAISEDLPEGSCLLVLPPDQGPTWDTLFALADTFDMAGTTTEILSAAVETLTEWTLGSLRG